ncbi:serine hydrolase domain-containing protein [Streptomyces sp. NPDC018019]|uniref:serine hydrolase domain-containing protein n=1 Tax=Streptomyces sp. NPDC018019 TaxID=3365030 RepID=UPI003789CC3E
MWHLPAATRTAAERTAAFRAATADRSSYTGAPRPSRAPGRLPVLTVVLAVLAALATLTSCTGVRAPQRTAPLPAPLTLPPDRTTPALRRLVHDGAPGAAALSTVGARGQASRFATAGVADLRSGRTIRRADHFRAGSLTKPFVAAVVLQLAAEHRLGLQDPVLRRLPRSLRDAAGGAAGELSRVTIRQLLDHTSGLFNYTRDRRLARQLYGSGFRAHRYDSHTPAELLRTALSHPPTAPPGARYAYSNTNYLLLGLVIEHVTGHPYAEEVTRRIVRPVRLSGTSFPGTDPALPEPYGRGYSLVGARRVDATALDPSRAGSAGEMVTTLGDLNRFFAALLGGELLPPRETAQLRNASRTGGAYGLGLYAVELPCGTTVWGHNGDINGSYAQTATTADGRHVLSLHVNTDTRAAADHAVSVLAAEFCRAGPPGRTG